MNMEFCEWVLSHLLANRQWYLLKTRVDYTEFVDINFIKLFIIFKSICNKKLILSITIEP